MESTLYFTAAYAVGASMGACVPRVVKRVVDFECRKYGRPFIRDGFSRSSRVVLILFMMAAAVLSALFTPLKEAPFYFGFCVIAIVGTLVDRRIRIIPNEMLLLLFALGFAYRLMTTGFSGLLRSLLASLLAAAVFALAARFTFLLKKNIGVGAGDVKLAVTIAFVVGFPGVYLFLFGTAAVFLLYCLTGLLIRKLSISSTFPMCGQIMAGFVFALFAPRVPGLIAALPLPV